MKTLLTLFITFTLIVLSACSNNDEEPWVPKTIELDAKSAQLVEAGNEFGLDLFQRIYAEENKYDNIMVSPLSVSLALAMTYNGANAETKTAMEETLKVYGLSPDDINQSYKNLVTALQSLDPKVVLEIANAIFYKQGFQVENNFVSTNKNYYDAEVEALDFNSPEAVDEINDWVADKTHDKIDNIIDNISADHVMFLLNAIYFNGIWQTEFDKDNTKDLPFYTENDGTINVPSMQKTDAVPYVSNNLFSAVQLGYGAGNYSMYVFLPQQDNSIQDIIDQLNENTWSEWMDSFKDSANIDIQLPRLKYEYEIKLDQVLSDMGMGIAFTGNADFTGINKGGNLKIDYVKHKTFIEVNEQGTEAAAVTVVAIELTSVGPPQNIQFRVNSPFFYAITEKDTGAILFMGTVKNPKE
jgi:serpin B